MKRIHIVGRKNHGKTQLLVDLVGELRARGVRVGTVKHTHHRHELDTPGKDSYRHRMAGSAVVGIVSPSIVAVYLPNERPGEPTPDACYERLGPLYAECDVVLVEGDLRTGAPKVEVWRAELGGRPLAVDHPGIGAVVTDDSVTGNQVVFRRADLARLADWLLQQAAATGTAHSG